MLKVMIPMDMSLCLPNLLLLILSDVNPMMMQKMVNTAMNAGPAKTFKTGWATISDKYDLKCDNEEDSLKGIKC
jgi:hypothetical protein